MFVQAVLDPIEPLVSERTQEVKDRTTRIHRLMNLVLFVCLGFFVAVIVLFFDQQGCEPLMYRWVLTELYFLLLLLVGTYSSDLLRLTFPYLQLKFYQETKSILQGIQELYKDEKDDDEEEKQVAPPAKRGILKHLDNEDRISSALGQDEEAKLADAHDPPHKRRPESATQRKSVVFAEQQNDLSVASSSATATD